MLRTLMKSKAHRATVTGADLHYIGSITLDPDLMAAADLVEHEKVQVLDIENGARLETYVIAGERGAGEVCLNGPAARLVQPGDHVIVISYATYTDEEARAHVPTVVYCDERNRPVPGSPEQAATTVEEALRGFSTASRD